MRMLITEIDSDGDDYEDHYVHADTPAEALEIWKAYLKKAHPGIDFRKWKPLEHISEITEFENDQEWETYCQCFIGGYRPDFINEPQHA